MICKWCGKPVNPGQKNCPACGREVPPLSECGGFHNVVPNWTPPVAGSFVTETPVQKLPAADRSTASPSPKKRRPQPFHWLSLLLSLVALLLAIAVLTAVMSAKRDIRKIGEDLQSHLNSTGSLQASEDTLNTSNSTDPEPTSTQSTSDNTGPAPTSATDPDATHPEVPPVREPMTLDIICGPAEDVSASLKPLTHGTEYGFSVIKTEDGFDFICRIGEEDNALQIHTSFVKHRVSGQYTLKASYTVDEKIFGSEKDCENEFQWQYRVSENGNWKNCNTARVVDGTLTIPQADLNDLLSNGAEPENLEFRCEIHRITEDGELLTIILSGIQLPQANRAS